MDSLREIHRLSGPSFGDRATERGDAGTAFLQLRLRLQQRIQECLRRSPGEARVVSPAEQYPWLRRCLIWHAARIEHILRDETTHQ